MKVIYKSVLVTFLALSMGVFSAAKGQEQKQNANAKSEKAKITKSKTDQKKMKNKKKVDSATGKVAKSKKGVPKRMYAEFTLTHGGEPFGKFKAKLFFKRAPNTVDNFVELAEGKKEFTEALKGKEVIPGKPTKRRFYDGIAFHRVIRGFMIQGGDPTGTGRYTPGFEFEDEFHPNLLHDKPGTLSMANPGKPDKNGSQFFITVAKTPHLDKKHSVFGRVVEGYDVVEKASKIATDLQDKPKKPLVMETVKIIREH